MTVPLHKKRTEGGALNSAPPCLNQLSSLIVQPNQRRITKRVGNATQGQKEGCANQTDETTPSHFSSFMIKAVKLETIVSGQRHASLARFAFIQVSPSKVLIAQPY